MMVALIHPSVRIVPILTEVAQEVMADVDFIHIVDEGMHRMISDAGTMTEPVTRRLCSYARNAQESGAEAVVLTSPILGPALDPVQAAVRVPALRLDEAMADAAVQFGRHIGVLATANITLDPTVSLLGQRALTLGKEIILQTALCEEANAALAERGFPAYDQSVLRALEPLRDNEVIVLADVLMYRVLLAAADLVRIPVLASPRPGFERLSKRLNYFRR